jgi:cobalt-zinc-cadmium resistance protein CzcA
MVDRSALARYGLNVTDVEQAVASGGSGDVISEVIDGQKRYTVALRLPERYRTYPDAMRKIAPRAPGGEQVALEQVARVQVRRGPELINREDGQRRIVEMSNVRGRDLGSFVAEVRARINRDVVLPTGYFIEYGGQFENQERATRRLALIVPVAITLVFALLYLTFASIKQARLVVGNVPFALVGGIAALDSRHECQPLRLHWVHRSFRRGDAQRSGSGQLDQSNARDRYGFARCRPFRRATEAASRIDDGVCGELRLYTNGPLNGDWS